MDCWALAEVCALPSSILVSNCVSWSVNTGHPHTNTCTLPPHFTQLVSTNGVNGSNTLVRPGWTPEALVWILNEAVSQIWPSPPSPRRYMTHERFLRGSTNTLYYSYPRLKSWASSAFRRLLCVLTAGWILLSFTICYIPQSRRASVARSASSCRRPLAPLSSLFFFFFDFPSGMWPLVTLTGPLGDFAHLEGSQ